MVKSTMNNQHTLLHCCPVNLKRVFLQLATYFRYRLFSGVGDMNIGNLSPSFRCRPESSSFNDFLDDGLCRHDGNKVNGTAVKLLRLMSGLVGSVAILLSVGCSTTHLAIPDPDYAPVRPISAKPLPISNGSIYKAGFGVTLFEDTKAHRIGDIITIILKEKTNASKTASTTTAKDATVDIGAPTIFGQGVTRNGKPILSASIDASRDFTGEGDSTQSNSLTGEISVTVADVLPNGNLVIRGEKLLSLNQGSEHIRISGIVRPSDVSPTNTVLSSQVANAHIVYGGQGVLAEVNSKGWLQRVFDGSWWPF